MELDETSSSLTLPSLGLTDNGIYSCMGVNTLGDGLSDSLQIEVTGESVLLSTLPHDLLSWSHLVGCAGGGDWCGGRI